MKTIKALLFDLDGTILDSKQSVVEAMYRTTSHYYPGTVCRTEVEARFGESWDEYITRMGGLDKNAAIDTFKTFIKENFDENVSPFPGVCESLKLLRNTGYRLAIVTNNEWSLAIRGLRIWELDSLFEVIVTADDVKTGKPDPEPVEKACRELGIDVGEALMIGDTIYDAKAAQAAGVRCAIIDWYKSHRISRSIPDYYFYDMYEFVAMLISQSKKIAV